MDERRALYEKETRLESKILASKPIGKDDNVGAIRNVASLANLYQSLVWHSIFKLKPSPHSLILGVVRSKGLVHRATKSPPGTRRGSPLTYPGG